MKVLAMSTPDQKRNNTRLGLILASVAAVFFLGFMAKLVFLGK
jgi:hypothetical protein